MSFLFSDRNGYHSQIKDINTPKTIEEHLNIIDMQIQRLERHLGLGEIGCVITPHQDTLDELERQHKAQRTCNQCINEAHNKMNHKTWCNTCLEKYKQELNGRCQNCSTEKATWYGQIGNDGYFQYCKECYDEWRHYSFEYIVC